MRCEKNFITIKPIGHNYLIFNLDTYVHKTSDRSHSSCSSYTVVARGRRGVSRPDPPRPVSAIRKPRGRPRPHSPSRDALLWRSGLWLCPL